MAQAFGQQTLSLTPTPEPASLTLLSLGGLSMVGYSWRRKKAVTA